NGWPGSAPRRRWSWARERSIVGRSAAEVEARPEGGGRLGVRARGSVEPEAQCGALGELLRERLALGVRERRRGLGRLGYPAGGVGGRGRGGRVERADGHGKAIRVRGCA